MNWHPSQYLDDDRWGIVDDDNCIVVGLSSRITKETAQTICRAVNAHAELVAALEELINDAAQYEAWQRPCFAFDNARAVLAKVKK